MKMPCRARPVRRLRLPSSCWVTSGRVVPSRAPLLLLMAVLLVVAWPVAAAGPTYVGGPISTPTTWTLANSPYIVNGTVTIQQGAILTIEAGVTISFTAGTGLEIGNTTSSGRLVADGTLSQPITFTAQTASPVRGFWDGIEFSANSLRNTLRYCVIEYAGTGIYSDDSDSHVLDHCVFRHNGGDTPPPGGAMTIDGDGLAITDNQVYDNALGLRFRKSFNNTITGNQIYENDGFGIGFVVEIGVGGGNNTIADNQVHDNDGDGLYMDDGSNNQVLGNQIYGNGGSGVWARSQALLQLIGNIVRGNGQNGLTCVEPAVVPTIHSNVFCRNLGHGIEYFSASTTLPAEGNWFGTNSPTIGVEISGAVDFDPWISMTVAIEPPVLPADGASTAALTLTMSSGIHTVPDGYTVTVSVSAGSVAPPELVLDDGQADTTYTASTTPGPVEIEVTDQCATLLFTEVLTLTPALDLAVIKTDGGLIVGPNKDYLVEYTITVSNAGSITATNVLVTDTLPLAALYTGSDWSCLGDMCTRTLGVLAPAASIQVTLPVTLDKSALDCPIVLTNTVEVADGVLAGDIDPTNNVFTLTSAFDVECLPDLYVVLNDNVGPVPKEIAWAYERWQPEGTRRVELAPRLCVSPGELITYSIAYGNAGVVTATQVVLTETLPVHTTFVGTGWSCTGTICTRPVGTLAPGMGGIVSFIVRVDAVPPDLRIEDEVRIGGAEQDLYPPDNVSYDDTPVCDVCLQLVKEDNTPCAFPGDEIRYTITFSNTCDEPTTGLVLTEAVPDYTSFLTSPGWLPLGVGQFVYNYGTLAPYTSDSIEFVVVVDDPLPITVTQTVNVVCLGHGAVVGSELCYSLVTPLPLEPDLRVIKKDHIGPPPPDGVRRELDRFYQVLYDHPSPQLEAAPQAESVGPGDIYSYTITYLNLGRMPATGVVLTDTLPPHTTYVGYGWTQVGPNTYTRTVGDLGVQQGGQRNLYVRVNDDACTHSGYLYNWAYIGGDQAECNLGNNVSGEETPADLPICQNRVYLPLVLKGYEGPPPPPTPEPTPPPSTDAYVSDVAVNAETNRVYVASPQWDAVFAVNPDGAGSIVAKIPVGDYPLGLAVVTTTNKIYAANLNSWTVTAIDGSDHTPITDIYAGVQPCKAAADSNDMRVYVANHLEPDNGIAAIDSEDDTFIHYYNRMHATQGRYGIDVDPVNEKLFVAARDAGLIVIQDADLPDQEPFLIKLDPPRVPFIVAYNPTTQHLFVTAPDNNLVVVLAPYSLELYKGRWTMYKSRTVFVLDRANAGWIKEIGVGNGAEEGIAVNPVTGLVYVTNAVDGTVSVIQDDLNPANIVKIKDIDVGDYPQGVDVDVYLNMIYVGNAGSRSLSVIDGTTNTVVKTIPLFPLPLFPLY
jgi:uncharacterized repeat protein (TIGR01451 family)